MRVVVSAGKARERLYLDLARELLPSLPAGEAIASESPDFLIRTTNRTVGIEVTRFAWPRNESGPLRDGCCIIRPGHLQRVIDRKSRRLTGYSVDGRSTWLVVVLDRRPARCTGWVTPALLDHHYRSAFAGVALLEFNLGKCWDLYVLATRDGTETARPLAP